MHAAAARGGHFRGRARGSRARGDRRGHRRIPGPFTLNFLKSSIAPGLVVVF